MNTNENTELLALASIMQGLLASGHFTRPLDPEAGEFDSEFEPDLIRSDWKDIWKDEDVPPYVTRRHAPSVMDSAIELLELAKLSVKNATENQ